jgi:hypothetical protein
MTRLIARRVPVWAISTSVVGLAAFGVLVTVRATWTVTHGGSPGFDGAFDYPGWSVAHFVSALLFVTILPFQLVTRLRSAWPRAHRIAGRAAAGSGVIFSLTGLLLPWVMPARPFGELAFMTTMGLVFPFLLGRGIVAAWRHDFAAHRRWMLRVTAFALGPLTERVIFPFFAAAGIDSMLRFWDLFVSALWFSVAINFVVVEWWIQRTATPVVGARSTLQERMAI